MNIVKTDLGKYLNRANRNSQSDPMRNKITDENGREGGEDTPAEGF